MTEKQAQSFSDKGWNPPDRLLKGQTGVISEEDKVDFEGTDLNGPAFRKVFDQFRHLVRSCTYPAGSRWSLNLMSPDTDSGWLGPAAAGKMASNFFWIIRFVKEGGVWKVWQLQVDYTH